MKFVKLCNLSLSIAMTITAVLGPGLLVKHARDTDIERAKILSYKPRPVLTVKIDTLNLNRENFNTKYPKAIAGVFTPLQNNVSVTYYNTTDNAEYINRICNHQNGMLPLTLRHEMEHARKAHLTKITPPYYSAQTRARIAAINETMAPAGEIIEAMDYHYTNQKPIPTCKIFVQNACDSILKAIGEQTPTQPINFNNQKIADIVIENALERFKGEIKTGQYVSTLQREYFNKKPIKYTPHQDCNPMLALCFAPQFDMWAPLWQFETVNGPANPWLAASAKTRKKVLHEIDSIIYKYTGKKPVFFNNVIFPQITTR